VPENPRIPVGVAKFLAAAILGLGMGLAVVILVALLMVAF
jgi:hypothetical protein